MATITEQEMDAVLQAIQVEGLVLQKPIWKDPPLLRRSKDQGIEGNQCSQNRMGLTMK